MNSKVIKKENIDENVSLGDRLEIEDTHQQALSSDKKVISENDMTALKEAQDIISKAHKDAEEIKTKAKALYCQVEEKMEKSRKKGFEEGKEEGFAKVTEELTRIQKEHHEVMHKVEREGVSLIYEIAQKIIGDALNTSDDALIGMIRQALLSSMGNELMIFVNPADLDRIKSQESKLMSVLQAIQTMQIKASENIQPGGCVIESELGSIDARLDLQMDAIKKALEI